MSTSAWSDYHTYIYLLIVIVSINWFINSIDTYILLWKMIVYIGDDDDGIIVGPDGFDDGVDSDA